MGQTTISMAIFALLSIAIVNGQGNCGRVKSVECLASYVPIRLAEVSQEEHCEEMAKVAMCLNNVLAECDERGERHRDPAFAKALTDVQTKVLLECSGSGESVRDLEAEKCVEENNEYVKGCIAKSVIDAGTLLGISDVPGEEIDMDVLLCVSHSYIVECSVERVTEKCGKEVGEKIQEQMKEIPEEVREACSAPESMEFMASHLNFDGDKK